MPEGFLNKVGGNFKTVEPDLISQNAIAAPMTTGLADEANGMSLLGKQDNQMKPLLMEQKAQQQSSLGLFGKFMWNVGNTIGREVANIPGYIGGGIAGAAGEIADPTGNSFIETATNNFWVNSVQSASDDIKNMIPTYMTDDAVNGKLWDRMTDGTWWATTGADGVGFMLSMFVPGAATKAIGVGAKLANTATKLGKGSKYLKEMGLLTELADSGKLMATKKLAGSIDGVVAAGVNTYIEAAAEAGNTFDNAFNKFKEEHGEQKAREMAGNAAADVFKQNLAILAVSNIIDQHLLFNAFGKSPKSPLGTFFKDGKLVMPDIKPKTLLKELPVHTAKSFAKEGFFEEGLQYAAEHSAVKEQETGKQTNIFKEYINEIFESPEMQSSIMLGSILGSVAGGVGVSRDTEDYNRMMFGGQKVEAPKNKFLAFFKQERPEQKGLYNMLKDNFTSMYTKLSDIQTIGPDGKVTYDQAKLAQLRENMDKRVEAIGMIDMLRSEGRHEIADQYEEQMMADYVHQFLVHEHGAEVLDKHIESELGDAWAARYEANSGKKATAQEIEQYKTRFKKVAQITKESFDEVYGTHIDIAKLDDGDQAFQQWADMLVSSKFNVRFRIGQIQKRIDEINAVPEATTPEQILKADKLEKEKLELQKEQNELTNEYVGMFSDKMMKKSYNDFKTQSYRTRDQLTLEQQKQFRDMLIATHPDQQNGELNEAMFRMPDGSIKKISTGLDDNDEFVLYDEDKKPVPLEELKQVRAYSKAEKREDDRKEAEQAEFDKKIDKIKAVRDLYEKRVEELERNKEAIFTRIEKLKQEYNDIAGLSPTKARAKKLATLQKLFDELNELYLETDNSIAYYSSAMAQLQQLIENPEFVTRLEQTKDIQIIGDITEHMFFDKDDSEFVNLYAHIAERIQQLSIQKQKLEKILPLIKARIVKLQNESYRHQRNMSAVHAAYLSGLFPSKAHPDFVKTSLNGDMSIEKVRKVVNTFMDEKDYSAFIGSFSEAEQNVALSMARNLESYMESKIQKEENTRLPESLETEINELIQYRAKVLLEYTIAKEMRNIKNRELKLARYDRSLYKKGERPVAKPETRPEPEPVEYEAAPDKWAHLTGVSTQPKNDEQSPEDNKQAGVADRIADGEVFRFKQDDKIQKIKSNPDIYNWRENPDGTITLIGMEHPVTKEWVGEKRSDKKPIPDSTEPPETNTDKWAHLTGIKNQEPVDPLFDEPSVPVQTNPDPVQVKPKQPVTNTAQKKENERDLRKAEHIYSKLGKKTATKNVKILPWARLKNATEPVTEFKSYVSVATEKFTRKSVKKDKDTLYLFTDNAERTSSPTAEKENVDPKSRYYKKYKSTTDKPIHYGSNSNPTSAVIRGLDNAYPISTLAAYGVQWTDENFDLFKKTVDDEIQEILNSGFKKIVIPDGRIGKGPKSNLPDKHQEYLDSKLLELSIDNSGEKAKPVTRYAVISTRIKGKENHFGNPFNSDQKVLKSNPELIAAKNTKEAVIRYIDWILHSSEPRAEWIRQRIKKGKLKNTPIYYFAELNEPSHATALSYLIANGLDVNMPYEGGTPFADDAFAGLTESSDNEHKRSVSKKEEVKKEVRPQNNDPIAAQEEPDSEPDIMAFEKDKLSANVFTLTGLHIKKKRTDSGLIDETDENGLPVLSDSVYQRVWFAAMNTVQPEKYQFVAHRPDYNATDIVNAAIAKNNPPAYRAAEDIFVVMYKDGSPVLMNEKGQLDPNGVPVFTSVMKPQTKFGNQPKISATALKNIMYDELNINFDSLDSQDIYKGLSDVHLKKLKNYLPDNVKTKKELSVYMFGYANKLYTDWYTNVAHNTLVSVSSITSGHAVFRQDAEGNPLRGKVSEQLKLKTDNNGNILGGKLLMGVDGKFVFKGVQYNVQNGSVALGLDNGLLVPIERRFITADEINTAIDLMLLTAKTVQLPSPVRIAGKSFETLPLVYPTKDSKGISVLNTMINFGKRDGKNGELYSEDNRIYYTINDVTRSVSKQDLKTYRETQAQTESVTDFLNFMKTRKYNISKGMLTEGNLYFKPKAVHNGKIIWHKGVPYKELLIKSVLETHAVKSDSHPEALQRNIIFRPTTTELIIEQPTVLPPPATDLLAVNMDNLFADKRISIEGILELKLNSGEIIKNCR